MTADTMPKVEDLPPPTLKELQDDVSKTESLLKHVTEYELTAEDLQEQTRELTQLYEEDILTEEEYFKAIADIQKLGDKIQEAFNDGSV